MRSSPAFYDGFDAISNRFLQTARPAAHSRSPFSVHYSVFESEPGRPRSSSIRTRNEKGRRSRSASHSGGCARRCARRAI